MRSVVFPHESNTRPHWLLKLYARHSSRLAAVCYKSLNVDQTVRFRRLLGVRRLVGALAGGGSTPRSPAGFNYKLRSYLTSRSCAKSQRAKAATRRRTPRRRLKLRFRGSSIEVALHPTRGDGIPVRRISSAQFQAQMSSCELSGSFQPQSFRSTDLYPA